MTRANDRRRGGWLRGRSALLAALGLAAGAALAGNALAQQPPPGDRDPHTLPLGEVQPGGRPQPPRPPGAQPGQPGQGMPPGMQPGQLPPGRQFPPGMQPGQGMPPGQRPGMPPGFGPRPQMPPGHGEAGASTHVDEHGAGHAGGGHECPGHGPLDDPHPINWWQGLIRATDDPSIFEEKPDEHGHYHRKDSAVDQLLTRYENDKDECDPRNQPPPFLASLLNFGLLAFILYRFGKKPLQEALSARKRAVMSEIETAEELYNAALARLEALEDKLQHVDEARDQMKADYAAQGEAERKHVLSEAEERRGRMKRDVEFRIAQELKTAKAQLVHEAVESAVAAANEVLRSSVTQADRDRAADEYLAGLEVVYKSEPAKAQPSASHDAGGAA